jgi:putative oxidoreductase
MSTKKLLFGNDSDANVGLLILRVFIGAAMFTHGWYKISTVGVDAFAQNVAGMGIPAPALLGYLAVFAESGGALLLALGLLTRPAAFLLVCTMGVAIGVALKGKPFSDQEIAWLYLVSALFFLLKGAGQWSVDALLSKQKA